MKNVLKMILVLALAVALAVPAFAEEDAAVKGIFDALVAEDSNYAATKALFEDLYPGCEITETLEGDRFTLAIAESGDSDGSWTFTRDGDYLTSAAITDEDYTGYMLALDVLHAVGDYLGMDNALLTGLIAGLGQDNPYFISDDQGVRIYIAKPYDMSAVDEMVIDDKVLDDERLGTQGEDYTSIVANEGRLTMFVKGSVDEVDILLAEYGGLNELAYKSIVNIVNALKPKGYEDFLANYTELSDAEADSYKVTLNVGQDVVNEIIDQQFEGLSFMLVHFGK